MHTTVVAAVMQPPWDGQNESVDSRARKKDIRSPAHRNRGTEKPATFIAVANIHRSCRSEPTGGALHTSVLHKPSIILVHRLFI